MIQAKKLEYRGISSRLHNSSKCAIIYVNHWRCFILTTENTLKLMECKLQSFKNAYWKAKSANDEVAAKKWREGCVVIYKRIDKLKKA